MGLAGFIVSHTAGRPLALHGWVCQRAWDGGAWSAVLLPNKTQAMILGAACGFIGNVDPVGWGFPVVRVRVKEV